MIRRHRSGMVLAGMVLTLLTLGSATPAFAVTAPLPPISLPRAVHQPGRSPLSRSRQRWSQPQAPSCWTGPAMASADVLRRVRAGQAPEAAAHAYDEPGSFLEEFYPGTVG